MPLLLPGTVRCVQWLVCHACLNQCCISINKWNDRVWWSLFLFFNYFVSYLVCFFFVFGLVVGTVEWLLGVDSSAWGDSPIVPWLWFVFTLIIARRSDTISWQTDRSLFVTGLCMHTIPHLAIAYGATPSAPPKLELRISKTISFGGFFTSTVGIIRSIIYTHIYKSFIQVFIQDKEANKWIIPP